LICCSVNGQKSHEIKINGIELVFTNDLNIYYEYQKRANGIETGLSFGKNDVYIGSIVFVAPDFMKFDRTFIEWKLAYKRYVNRFFYGFLVALNYEIKREEAYFDYFLSVNGNEAEVDKIGRLGYGIYLGHKWTFNEKLIIEPSLSIDVDLHPRERTDLVSIRGLMGFKVGLKL